ncbi:hypothetical protein JQ597_22345 [Bradyrhizobium sp. AUGA SZCCT0177]|uniref:hypothetical protein n=1 Tax=Bradyrhizobium sp. AUGA SZCCT0177 TaxID=2807665 RepID=UPI001BA8C496|nr:hypothetical protein [Bradyrhizobium sp. AUGA SZCCT0177]MBR1284792.1 hypothetical protein [Bradyrhizobium sp. AUGA SZCCT0177]
MQCAAAAAKTPVTTVRAHAPVLAREVEERIPAALTEFIVKKSLAPRIMDRLLGSGPGLMACCRSASPSSFFRNGLERIAAGQNTGNGANYANAGG